MSTQVSILTVTYNSASTISTAIRSVLNQSVPPLEYIIVDGASTDNTLDVVRSFIPAFTEKGIDLRIISESDNGMYDALNKGIRFSRGTLIGNINSDDWYEPDAIKIMTELYEETHYDLAWGSIYVHTDNKIRVKKARLSRIWTTANFCHPAMFGTKETELAFPYACRQMDDDFDMVTRVYKAGKSIAVSDKIITNYVFGGMSTTKSISKMFYRIGMKYRTYRRNNMSPLYWFYCVAIEFYKYLIG